MMSTVIGITVTGVPDAKAAPAVDAAFAEMERLAGVLSEWEEGSEISRVNAAAGGAAVEVGPDALAVVQAALDVARWSDGAFDPTWAALHGLYRFGDEERLATPEELRAKVPLIDYHSVEVDAKASTVRLARKGMLLGLGGIAKGYALDRAGAILKQAGITSFMLFGGGQVQVFGTRGGRPWRVGIQHPRTNDYFGFLQATKGSISTSGDYEHAFMRDGKRWHHIVDPKTGLPVAHTSSVSVIADSGVYADALSTAVFVLGVDKALPKLAQAPGNPRIVVVDADMKLHVGPNLNDTFVLRAKLDEQGRLPR
jgi:thiamine biosynthesis lipoprotein